MNIAPASPDHPDIVALLKLHLAAMHDHTPPEFAFALNGNELSAPEITFLAAWDGDALMGIGALKQFSATEGEVKSMRTHPDHLRRGVAAARLRRILSEARALGLERLYLETGTSHHYDAAIALYHHHGFTPCPPFADYKPSPHNQFMVLEL